MKKILVFCFCVFTFLGCGNETIEEVALKSFDLTAKGDAKGVEYFYFEHNYSKEQYLRYLPDISKQIQDGIKEHGGIKSRDVMIVSKSEDGKSAQVRLVIKFKDGTIDKTNITEMINVDSKWLVVY